jgi:predicted GNAT family acetyltransferase
MTARARAVAEPGDVLSEAGAFLAGDPVRHNLIMTLLHARVARPEPGRYWVVDVAGSAAGIVFQSPLRFVATVTPMPDEAVRAAVEAIAEGGVPLPGVTGEAATVARFAGHWAEVTKVPAHPVEAQRIYEAHRLNAPPAVQGAVRPACWEDRDLLITWVQGFQDEVGGWVTDPVQVVERRLQDHQLWIWDDNGPAAMAGLSIAVAGAVRIGPVYTPAARRNRGYASALVASLSSDVKNRGQRCMLYTELANPTSNSIYRAIGYRAVAEVLMYRFGDTRPL